MTKSPDAFRTISEVAEWLDRPAHVLRFWESKFSQVKPIKRAGGRRYFRPQDMLLLGGIKKLLHDDGLTIKGVQKILREEGVDYVIALSQPLDEQASAGELVPSPEKVAALKAKADNPESATLLQFPGAKDAAEDELTSTAYEEAAQDLAPVSSSDEHSEDVGAPEGPLPDETPAGDTQSFFSMFEEEPSAEPQPEPAMLQETEGGPAEPEPEKTDIKPEIIDVPVDASSVAGAGILTRVLDGQAALRNADPKELEQIRERLTALRVRFANNAAGG